MRKLLLGAILLAVMAAGCAITDYPIITDTRGDYTGIIRTGHKAFIIPYYGQVATIWSDGTDNIFSMVYQNQYGDAKYYTFNNFDPTGLVMFFENGIGSYCDWRYTGCEITRAWNPHTGIDDVFDYEFFPDCSGARSLSILISYGSRYYGECGDGRFQSQAFAAEFANLPTTMFRGEPAYVLSMNAANTSLVFNGVDSAPLYGQMNAVITPDLEVAVPMTPNTRHLMGWVSNWIGQNGPNATLSVTYGAVNTEFNVRFAGDGIAYNLSRF